MRRQDGHSECDLKKSHSVSFFKWPEEVKLSESMSSSLKMYFYGIYIVLPDCIRAVCLFDTFTAINTDENKMNDNAFLSYKIPQKTKSCWKLKSPNKISPRKLSFNTKYRLTVFFFFFFFFWRWLIVWLRPKTAMVMLFLCFPMLTI